MTRATRYFVIVASAVLVVGLTGGLVASYMGLPVPVLSRTMAPDAFGYVPADATVVAYANVREVMDSELRQHFRRMEPHSGDREEFEARTGLNIERDIDSVVAAMMPRDGDVGRRGDMDRGVLVLARGRFDKARLEHLATEHGGSVEDYQGTRLLLTRADGDDHRMAMGFVESDLVALGSADAVRRAVDAGRGGESIIGNKEMMQQVASLDGNNAWAVGRFDAIAGNAALPDEVRAQVPAVTWFSAAGHVNGGLRGMLSAEARDDQSARNLEDLLRGFLALARMQAGSQPALKQVVDSLQLTGDGRTVTVRFSLPSEALDALGALGARRHRPRGGDND